MLRFSEFNESKITSKPMKRDIKYFLDVFRKDSNISINISLDDIHDYLVPLEDELELEYDVNQKLSVNYEKSKEGDIYYIITIEVIDFEEPEFKNLLDKSDFLKRRSESARVIHETISRINDSLGITLSPISSLSDEVMEGRYIFQYSEESNNLKQKFNDWFVNWNKKKESEIKNIISKIPKAKEIIEDVLGRFDDVGITNPSNYFSYEIKNDSLRIYGISQDPSESGYIIFDCPLSEIDDWESKFLEFDTFIDNVRWTR